MRQLLPHPTDDTDLEAGVEVGVDAIAAQYAYPDTGAIRANMVSSLDGAIEVNGRSAPVSGAPDRFMFGLLRALSDVVVVGAGTARAEGYGPGRSRTEFAHLRASARQLDTPVIAVVTNTADLDPTSALFAAARHRTLVVTADSAAKERRQALSEVADVLVTGDDTVDLATAFEQLRDRGLTRMLTEGGPRLLGDIAQADLLDELALSLSPLIAGGASGRILQMTHAVLQRMELRALFEDDDFLFGLYRRSDQGETE